MANIFRGPDRIVPTPNVSLGRFLYDSLKSHGKRASLICTVTGKTITYAELLDKSLRLAAGFRDFGIKEGDSVGFSSENNMDFYVVVLATFFVGATIAPINPTYVERELEHCLLISRPRLVIGSSLVIARVVPVVRQMVSAGHLPKETKTLLLGAGPSSMPGILTTHEFASQTSSIEGLPVYVRNAVNKVSFIMCSSGTTGLPKGVELTNKNAIGMILCMRDPRLVQITPDDTLSGLLPFFHMYGLTMGLVALTFGTKLAVFPKFEAQLFLAAIQNYKITNLFLVPPIVVFLAKHPVVSKFNLSSIREIWCGAAPLSKEMQDAVDKRLGSNVVRQGYGLTEATMAVFMSPLNCSKSGSSGKLVPGMMCKVVDLENGKTLGPNRAGELCFHGDLVMKGYKGNPAATDACLDAAGWVCSGDIGYFDDDGYVYIVDRLKELIKYKGFQVAPAELEALMLTHPSVQDVAVIGIPDEQAGELALAFVVRQPGSKLTEKEVVDFVAGQVSPSKRLYGGAKFIAAIPKTASGKILRRDLRELIKGKSKL